MKILLALIIAYGFILIGLVGFYHSTQKEILTLTQKITLTSVKNSELETTVKTLKESTEKQAAALVELNSKTSKATKEYEDSIRIFREHNITKIARTKPTLLEARINAATEVAIQEAINETATK